MSTSYEETGRARQKQRTRAALVAAARDLVARGGRSPTVAEAAEAASISRTTAYRYFPTQNSLLLAAHPEIEATSMLPADVGEDPEVRLEAAVRGFLAMVIDTEPQQRTMLRLSLEEDSTRRLPLRPLPLRPLPLRQLPLRQLPLRQLPLRQGRAIGWFSEALEPLTPQLGGDGVRRLAVAVRAVSGIESLVWLTDVAGCTHDEAVEQMAWSAVALLRRAVQQE